MSSDHEYSTFERLGQRVGRAIGEGPDDHRRARQRRALLEAQIPSAAHRRPRRLPRLAVAAAAAGLGLFLVLWQLSSPSLDYWIGGISETSPGQEIIRTGPNETVPVYFSDGSQVKLQSSTTARILESSTRLVRISLSRGTLSARVRSRPQTRYHVVAGPFTVEDIGTVFDVRWDPERAHLQVEVQEGAVLVSGGTLAGKKARVEAGAHLTLADSRVTLSRRGDARLKKSAPEELGAKPPPGEGSREEPQPRDDEPRTARRLFERPKSSPRARTADPRPTRPERPAREAAPSVGSIYSDQPAPSRPAARAPARQVTPAPQARPTTWRQAYNEGIYRAAIRQARAKGLARLARVASSDDLWKLASAARYARDRGAARLFLSAIRKRFSSSRRARTAAYLLGRVAIELANDAPRAIQWFETYLNEDPRGPLTEEAHGRLIIACQRARRHASARTWARRYLKRYGDGLYAKIARAVVKGRHP